MPKTPSYRRRAGYTQAIVTLSDSRTGTRRDFWLGEHGSPQSREAYHRLIAEWESAGRRLPDGVPTTPSRHAAPTGAGDPGDRNENGAETTVLEVIRAYWRFAKGYYRPNEYATLRVALRLLRRFDGRTPAAEYGPKRLRLLREAMIRGDPDGSPPRRPWSRVYANQQTRRIRQMFKWAASHEMVPASVHVSLATVESLKRGRCAAREGKKVVPVPLEMVEATRPHLSRQVRALVDLQLLTGARSGEILKLRPIDLDTTDPSGVWVVRLAEHKTAARGRERVLYLGPAAQEVVRPFLADRPVDAFLFSPAEAEAERRAALTAARRTPASCGNAVGSNRLEQPAKKPGAHYTSCSYYMAVQTACDKALPAPERLSRRTDESGRPEPMKAWLARLGPKGREELAAWRKAHRWHPHQLRHNAATTFRREFGLEAAQILLGHASANVTDAIYAQRDERAAIEAARKIG